MTAFTSSFELTKETSGALIYTEVGSGNIVSLYIRKFVYGKTPPKEIEVTVRPKVAVTKVAEGVSGKAPPPRRSRTPTAAA